MELCVSMGIASIMLAAGALYLPAWEDRQQLDNAVQELFINLQRAKAEAVNRGVNCAVSFTETGYMVYLDQTTNYRRETGEELLAQVSWNSYRTIHIDKSENEKGVTFTKNSVAQPTVAFDSTGLAVTVNNVPGNGTIYLKNRADRKCRIVVSGGGRVRIEG